MCKSSDVPPMIEPPSPVAVIRGGNQFSLTPHLFDGVDEMWKAIVDEITVQVKQFPCVLFVAKTDDPRVMKL